MKVEYRMDEIHIIDKNMAIFPSIKQKNILKETI